jgi:hypothetical protein
MIFYISVWAIVTILVVVYMLHITRNTLNNIDNAYDTHRLEIENMYNKLNDKEKVLLSDIDTLEAIKNYNEKRLQIVEKLYGKDYNKPSKRIKEHE